MANFASVKNPAKQLKDSLSLFALWKILLFSAFGSELIFGYILGFEWYMDLAFNKHFPSYRIRLPVLPDYENETKTHNFWVEYDVNVVNFWVIPINYLARNIGHIGGVASNILVWLLISPFLIAYAFVDFLLDVAANFDIHKVFKQLSSKTIVEEWIKDKCHITEEKLAEYVPPESLVKNVISGLLLSGKNYSEVKFDVEQYSNARRSLFLKGFMWSLLDFVSKIFIVAPVFKMPLYDSLRGEQAKQEKETLKKVQQDLAIIESLDGKGTLFEKCRILFGMQRKDLAFYYLEYADTQLLKNEERVEAESLEEKNDRLSTLFSNIHESFQAFENGKNIFCGYSYASVKDIVEQKELDELFFMAAPEAQAKLDEKVCAHIYKKISVPYKHEKHCKTIQALLKWSGKSFADLLQLPRSLLQGFLSNPAALLLSECDVKLDYLEKLDAELLTEVLKNGSALAELLKNSVVSLRYLVTTVEPKLRTALIKNAEGVLFLAAKGKVNLDYLVLELKPAEFQMAIIKNAVNIGALLAENKLTLRKLLGENPLIVKQIVDNSSSARRLVNTAEMSLEDIFNLTPSVLSVLLASSKKAVKFSTLVGLPLNELLKLDQSPEKNVIFELMLQQPDKNIVKTRVAEMKQRYDAEVANLHSRSHLIGFFRQNRLTRFSKLPKDVTGLILFATSDRVVVPQEAKKVIREGLNNPNLVPTSR